MYSLAKVREKITQALAPTELELMDESAAHAGHYPVTSGDAGPSHLRIRIASKHLEGLSRVQQHQAIYALVRPELDSGALHALRIEVL